MTIKVSIFTERKGEGTVIAGSKRGTVIAGSKSWSTGNEETEEYDAIHCVAGAILAGAKRIRVERES